MTIDKAFNLGQDAYKNLFAVLFDSNFTFFADQGLTKDDLMFRMTQFAVPASGVGTEEIHWMTQKFTRNTGLVIEEKAIQLQDVRVDAGFKVLQAFSDWKDAAVNSYTGSVGSLTAPGMTTGFSVQPVSSQSISDGSLIIKPGVGSYDFETCWCSDISGVSFSMEDGGHMTFTPTLVFLKFKKNIGRTDPNFKVNPLSYV